MDKKVFLLDKFYYSETIIDDLTEEELEKWVAAEEYDDEPTIIKIDADAKGYGSVEEAFINEMPFEDIDDFYVIAFGF